MSYAMDRMLTRRKEHYGLAVYGVTTAAVVLYAAFYPVLIGLYVPRWYVLNFLRWFTTWPI
jgi:dolichyl-phosphate-mannose--protein O-mannosyl transferase